MDREKALKQRQAEWLGRLVQGRPVFVYAWELGRAAPILNGVENCAPFFRPWDNDCACEYFQGSVAISTSLMTLVANGHAKTVADHFQGERKVRLSGLSWPHNALAFVSAGDKAGVREVLNRRPPHDQWTGLAVAAYWRKVLRDTPRMRQCLDAVMPSLGDPDIMWPAEREGVGALLPLLHDWPKTEALRWVINSMHGTDAAPLFIHAGVEEAFQAQVWMEILGNERWTRWLLKQASVSDSSGHPRAYPASARFCRYRLAMLYIKLLDDHRHADYEVAKALRFEHQCLASAAMYWRCFRDNPAETRTCLTQWSEEATGWQLMQAADAWMLHFDEKGKAMELVEDRKRQQMETREETMFRNARFRFALFGDRAPMDRLLERSMNESRGSMSTMHVKNWLLHDLGDMESYRACLRHEESICRNALYLTSCARDWMEHCGDREAAERCLAKAATSAKSESDVLLCAQAHLSLFEDMTGASQILQ